MGRTRDLICTVTVNNVPEEIDKYLVARKADDGTIWYYADFETEEKAKRCVAEIDGILFIKKEDK